MASSTSLRRIKWLAGREKVIKRRHRRGNRGRVKKDIIEGTEKVQKHEGIKKEQDHRKANRGRQTQTWRR